MIRAITLATLVLSLGATARAAENTIPDEYKKALEKAETLELYSLDPGTPGGPKEKIPDAFHNYKVLGKTEVKKEALTKLRAAFNKGVEEADPNVAAGCFHPRHGIRVTLDGKSYDFVVCFECLAVMVYGGKKDASFHISGSPADVFNGLLKDAKVKLPEQPEKK